MCEEEMSRLNISFIKILLNIICSVSAVDFQYYTVTRDCIVVKKGEYDGCYEELPSSGPVRRLFENTLDGYNIGEVKFKGHACYYDELTSTAAKFCPTPIIALLIAYFLFIM